MFYLYTTVPPSLPSLLPLSASLSPLHPPLHPPLYIPSSLILILFPPHEQKQWSTDISALDSHGDISLLHDRIIQGPVPGRGSPLHVSTHIYANFSLSLYQKAAKKRFFYTVTPPLSIVALMHLPPSPPPHSVDNLYHLHQRESQRTTGQVIFELPILRGL